MKKKLLLLLISLCVVISGYFLFRQYEKNQLVKEAQTKAEEFIYRNYEEIQTVQMNKNDYHFSPMGSLLVNGYINDDTKLKFGIKFTVEDNKIGNITAVIEAPVFPPAKKECKNNFCE